MPTLERVRPWLGTLVAIRAAGDDDAQVIAAIDAAFQDVARVHAAMSFQSEDSDLAAVGRLHAGATCRVDPLTASCLQAALDLARDSDGAFDPVVPDAGSSWRDVAIEDDAVCVRRPLRIDLSGIAKGFAVDRAIDRLRAAGLAWAMVNAGGDLRVFGGIEHTVALTPQGDAPAAAIVLTDGALASSDVAGSRSEYGAPCHWDGRDGHRLAHGFVSVLAATCRDADALTKVVLTLGEAALPILTRYAAIAYRYGDRSGWSELGTQG